VFHCNNTLLKKDNINYYVKKHNYFSERRYFKEMNINKKGQTGGLITGLIFGIASLVIGVIIAFVIVSTLTDANLLTSGRTSATESDTSGVYINQTGNQLASLDANYIPGGISIVSAYNVTSGQLISSGNYSVSSTGLVTNASATNYNSANITYSNSIYSTEEVSSSKLSGNFTAGVDNVSTKIPTVLLVAAIVLILGVLVLLVATWQRMNMGGRDGI